MLFMKWLIGMVGVLVKLGSCMMWYCMFGCRVV